MFWYLLLAHFIADYPLQPNWMVRNKIQLWSLSLHIGVHLIVMLAIVGQLRQFVWTQILILALTHFVIDIGKNIVHLLKPKWVVGPYVIDQIFHFLSIWIISVWIERLGYSAALPLEISWIILAIGYLLVTYVWFITEKILTHANSGYRLELRNQLWSRMLSRAALLSGLMFLGKSFPVLALAVPQAERIPYLSGDYRLRAFFTDLGVVLAVLIFIQLAI